MTTGGDSWAMAGALSVGGSNTYTQANTVAGATQPYFPAFWSYTPSRDGLLHLDTEGTTTSGSFPDTMLVVYTGSSPGVQVAADDDSGTGPLSSLDVNVTAGTTYHILVGAFSSDGDQIDDYHLNATFTAGHLADYVYDWTAFFFRDPTIILTGGTGPEVMSDSDPATYATFPAGKQWDLGVSATDFTGVGATKARVEIDVEGTGSFNWFVEFYTGDSPPVHTALGEVGTPITVPGSLSYVRELDGSLIYDDPSGLWSVAHLIAQAVATGPNAPYADARFANHFSSSTALKVTRYQLIVSAFIEDVATAAAPPLRLTNRDDMFGSARRVTGSRSRQGSNPSRLTGFL